MNRVVAVLGPTAVGKSWLGLQLAQEVGGEIISADALQAYRGFDIGTAKPSRRERARVRHHLVDILDPEDSYSAGAFARRAETAIEEILHRSRCPLVVGGSGFYLRALLQGLSPIPPVRPEVREALRIELARDGLPKLYQRLQEVDPDWARQIEPGDTQRVLRALEVSVSTGEPLTYWHARERRPTTALAVARIGLTLPREVLYDRVAQRVGKMISRGWVQEVEALLEAGVTTETPAFQAIGYRQLADHVRGRLSLEEATEDIIRSTRRYAKRQLTWFRREPSVSWFSMEESQECCRKVLDHLQRPGIGGGHDQS